MTDEASKVVQQRPARTRYEATYFVESYDRLRYHGLGGRYNNWRLRRLLGKAVKALPAGALVLDVPCGTGRIDNWLLRASLRVIAADISAAMLAVARRKVRPTPFSAGFLNADAGRLPLRSRSVEAVFSIRLLHLIDRPARLAVLSEMARVTRQWVVVEYRTIEKRVKAAKRVVIQRLTGRPRPRKKMALADVEHELSLCGLVAERYYFPSRWFSGSVVVIARRRDTTG